MLSISVVDKRFKEVVWYLELEYVIPSRATVTKCIEKHFEEKKDDLLGKLALITSCWAALKNESYIAATFISVDWEQGFLRNCLACL